MYVWISSSSLLPFPGPLVSVSRRIMRPTPIFLCCLFFSDIAFIPSPAPLHLLTLPSPTHALLTTSLAGTSDAIFLGKPACYDPLIELTTTTTRPALYTSKPIPDGAGVKKGTGRGRRGPTHRLAGVRFVWSDVRLVSHPSQLFLAPGGFPTPVTLSHSPFLRGLPCFPPCLLPLLLPSCPHFCSRTFTLHFLFLRTADRIANHPLVLTAVNRARPHPTARRGQGVLCAPPPLFPSVLGEIASGGCMARV